MAEPKYTDILIDGDDIATDAAGQPIPIYDRAVISQDITHALREAGVLTELIAERSTEMRRHYMKKIKVVVETDPRVIPGSSTVTESTPGNLQITADTEFGKIDLAVVQEQ